MKRILCSDWLPKRARWANLCPLGIARFVPAKAKFFGIIFRPYNKSFIDQACSVKMAGYWPRSFFFCVFMDRALCDRYDSQMMLDVFQN